MTICAANIGYVNPYMTQRTAMPYCDKRLDDLLAICTLWTPSDASGMQNRM